MNKFIRIAIVCLGLAAVPALAQAAELFMLIPGVGGDAIAKGHERWIRVTSLDWNVEAASSWTKGGGASVGKPDPGVIEFIVPTGTWSQHFMRKIGLGRSEANVVIDAVASDGRPLYRMSLEGFFVTQYRLATLPATPLPQDYINGVFKKVKVEYYSTGADGKLVTTFFEWDIPAGTVVPL